MDALLLVVAAAALLAISYFSYGRWLSNRVFQLRGDATTPAVSLRDDRDYCPTKRSVVFGHHFTSIAGTGPIVGPAIAVMWGWVPAVIWVVLGAIFIGAVHDLGSLAVSLKNKGRTVGDIAGDLLGPRVRTLFLVILIVALWIVLAIFGLVIAAVLRQYPGAIVPVLVQIPLALAIGVFIHRRGGSIVLPSLVALALMYASVFWGDAGPLHAFNQAAAAAPTWVWVLGLLGYAYVASVLPVWTLLQPRDYINAMQLITALGLLVAGLVGAALVGGEPIVAGAERVPLELVAPAVNASPEGAPPMIPVLFITIACGAISGFHCLVSSGTTSKQLKSETDAQAVGYGSMLTESFLATLVIAACAAGIGLGSGLVPSTEALWSPYSKTFTGIGGISIADPEGRLEVRYSREQNLIALREGAGTIEWNLTRTKPLSWSFSEETIKYESFGAFGVQATFANGQLVHDGLRSTSVTGEIAYWNQYSSWASAGSLGAKVGAFVDGAANLIASIGVPRDAALALMGVLVASFAGTTMDTACRLQRYVVQELARGFLPNRDGTACPRCGYALSGLRDNPTCPECGLPDAANRTILSMPGSPFNPFRWLATTHGATLFAVVTAAALAFTPAPGQGWSLASAGSGGLLLWPLFGATNQLLGGLAFIVIAAWLIKNRRPWWFIAPPAALMLALPAWALILQAFLGSENLESWWDRGQWALVGVSVFMLAVEVWMVAELAARLVNRREEGREEGETTGV